MKLLERLALIQKELKAPKSQYNAFGKYKYRNCEDILEAVKPLLVDVVLSLTDEVVFVGNRFYIKATATLTTVDSSGIYSVSAFAREEETKKGMDASQISGASSSYARKYALNGLFLIDDTKDADTTNQGDKPEPKPQKNVEHDVPEAIGEENSNILYFQNSDEESQKRTLKILAAKHKYEPKKPIDGMNAEDREKFFRFLLAKEK